MIRAHETTNNLQNIYMMEIVITGGGVVVVVVVVYLS